MTRRISSPEDQKLPSPEMNQNIQVMGEHIISESSQIAESVMQLRPKSTDSATIPTNWTAPYFECNGI